MLSNNTSLSSRILRQQNTVRVFTIQHCNMMLLLTTRFTPALPGEVIVTEYAQR